MTTAQLDNNTGLVPDIGGSDFPILPGASTASPFGAISMFAPPPDAVSDEPTPL